MDLKDNTAVETVKMNVFGLIQNMSSQTAKEKYLKLLATKIEGSFSAIVRDYENFSKTLVNQGYEEDFFDSPIEFLPADEKEKNQEL